MENSGKTDETTLSEARGATPKAPSIHDVARAAGVSTATVSRALSAPDKVRQATRDAVFRAIEETGYRLNMSARNLRKRETGAVAVLLPNLANPFFAAILSGIAEVLSDAGYSVLINDTTPLSNDDHRFPGFATKQHVDGLIVLDGLLDQDSRFMAGHPEARPAVVYACEWCDRIDRPRVVIDNLAASASAVDHLVALGHRRIGHISGPPGNVLTRTRFDGAKAAMAAAGLHMDDAWIFSGNFSLESGAQAARDWCASRNRPTGVFCASDVMAIGFIGELIRRGVEVPREVSVVGFDDLEMAAHFHPSLTTVHQPRGDIGRAAARMLLDRMRKAGDGPDDTPAPALVLPTRLVVRESTAPPPATG